MSNGNRRHREFLSSGFCTFKLLTRQRMLALGTDLRRMGKIARPSKDRPWTEHLKLLKTLRSDKGEGRQLKNLHLQRWNLFEAKRRDTHMQRRGREDQRWTARSQPTTGCKVERPSSAIIVISLNIISVKCLDCTKVCNLALSLYK